MSDSQEPAPPTSSPPTSTKTRGDAAEAAAARLLLEAGLEVVARNEVAGGVELDIIARDPRATPPLYIFVEVRSRADRRHGDPLESIDAKKRKRLIRGASAWLVRASLWERVAVRFDVIALTRDFSSHAPGRDAPLRDDEVAWIEGAFEVDD